MASACWRPAVLAGINFSGITASSVERDAIGRWVPQLCPSRSRQIQEVFAHLQRHHAD